MKKALSIILVLVLVLGLAACGGPKKGSPEAAVETLMTGIKEFDVKKIQSVMKEAVDDEDLGINEESEMLVDLLKQWTSKLTYKLGKSEVSGDTAKVPVDITYTDSSELMKAALTDYLTVAMQKAFSGEEVNEEEMSKLLMDTINETAKNVKLGTADASFTLELEKVNGEWKFIDMPDGMEDVLLSNMTKAFEGMFDGMFGD